MSENKIKSEVFSAGLGKLRIEFPGDKHVAITQPVDDAEELAHKILAQAAIVRAEQRQAGNG